VTPNLVQRMLDDTGLDVTLFRGDTGRLLREATLVIVASGTSTLEAALHETPMIVVYKVSPLSYQLGKALIRVPHIGLVNLIADRRLAPELIQEQASPAAIAKEALTFLNNPERLEGMKNELGKVARRLGAGGASAKVAEIAFKLLAKRSTRPSGISPVKDFHEA
jgi:lipid-A-disaccharide synthase